jgi:hypothetical protein
VQKFVVVVRPQVMTIITIYAFKMVLIVQRTSKIERERPAAASNRGLAGHD